MCPSDDMWMQAALDAARAVTGHTGDNPAVGCVIVKNGVLIGQGATQPPGGAHAEVVALRAAESAGHSVAGGELFVTLEPCCFTGRTPPCTQAVIGKGLNRVVIGVRDPHPRVRGAGVAELQTAGIAVVEGVLAAEAAASLSVWLERFPPICG